ncbi:MAG: glycosyltransferase family 4 protein, partial [Candidatus Omnitrophica bacterium]|nr:glycosyltransferase family 4 protein [Candidatus Omnitrophota bacterium]
DIPSIIGASDICLLAGSNPFGSPIALFEYMAMGKPVVAPRYQPIESIVDDGQDGLLFEPVDDGQFMKMLIELLQDKEKRTRLGRQARQKIEKEYTWENNARKILKLAEGL